METPQISILIAIYLSEKYLDRCVSSILQQEFTNFEVIFVDDGSPDHSYILCEKYIKQDSRFHLIRKKNGGLVSARQEGLKNARGEWVFFLDADDTIPSVCLKTLYNSAMQGYDVVKGCHYRIYKNVKSFCGYKGKERIFEGKEIFAKSLVSGDFPTYLWGTLFRRNLFIIDDFDLYKWATIGEDYLTMAAISKRVTSMLCIDDVVYHYFINESSIMQSRVYSNAYSDRVDRLIYMFLGSLDSDMEEKIGLKRIAGYIRNFFVPELSFSRKTYDIVSYFLQEPSNMNKIAWLLDSKFLKFIRCYPIFYIYVQIYKFLFKFVRLKGQSRKVL